MADSLTPLLLDAKKEYSVRLCEIMSPFIMKFLEGTYDAARDVAGDRKALIAFQERLRHVPSWNANIISEYTKVIEQKYDYFSDLMAAVFVSYVKVLSSIKISSQRPNVKLKLPTNELFVHQVYICTARNFYENPYAINESVTVKLQLIANAIETAVRNLLPLGDVLQAYLASAVNSDEKTMNPALSPAQSDEDEQRLPTPQSSSDDEEEEDDFQEERMVPFGAPPPQPPPLYTPPQPPHHVSEPPPPPPSTPPPMSSLPPIPHVPFPQQQQQQPVLSATSHPFPSQTSQPLFDDALDGEKQFR